MVAGITGSHPPGVFVQNWLGFGTQTYLPRPANPQEDQFQYSANLTYSAGKHTLKAGLFSEYNSKKQPHMNGQYQGNYNFQPDANAVTHADADTRTNGDAVTQADSHADSERHTEAHSD